MIREKTLWPYRYCGEDLIMRNALTANLLRPIMSITPLYKGKTILKLGIYPKLPYPEWESFCDKRQAWEVPLDGTVQYKITSFKEKVDGSPEKASPVPQ